MRFLFAGLLFLSSCFFHEKKCKVTIQNRSNLHLDSISIELNDYKKMMFNIRPNQTDKLVIDGASIKLKHDVVYRFTAYRNDTIVNKKAFFSNDLGYLPPRFGVIFNSNQQFIADSANAPVNQ